MEILHMIKAFQESKHSPLLRSSILSRQYHSAMILQSEKPDDGTDNDHNDIICQFIIIYLLLLPNESIMSMITGRISKEIN